jgi:lipopolysaccharide/colanic/teichoic acid biosynthesis glycosyltransferase
MPNAAVLPQPVKRHGYAKGQLTQFHSSSTMFRSSGRAQSMRRNDARRHAGAESTSSSHESLRSPPLKGQSLESAVTVTVPDGQLSRRATRLCPRSSEHASMGLTERAVHGSATPSPSAIRRRLDGAVLRILARLSHQSSDFAKRSLDVTFSLILCVMLLPLLIGIALAVKLTSPGPVLFGQYRRGHEGRAFVIYKFRTMALGRTVEIHLHQATRHDRRVTRLGRYLRRTSLDELPQLLNILRGDMSFVGPRPHALEHDERYGYLIPGYEFRQAVKPGLTGLAQVNGLRGETRDLARMLARVEMDLEYVKSRTLWLDVKILTKTAVRMWTDPNAY